MWRTVAFGGMVGGDGKALAMISHEGVDRRELQDRLRQRWPEMVLKDLGGEEPVWEMTAEDAADLGTRRRGVEPLRITIMPQRATRVTVAPAPVIEIAPMPVLVSEVQFRTTARPDSAPDLRHRGCAKEAHSQS